LPNFDRHLIQRPRETFGCDAFTPKPGGTCVLITTNSALSGARRADLTSLGAREPRVDRSALPKPVESGNLSLNIAFIRWMSDKYVEGQVRFSYDNQ